MKYYVLNIDGEIVKGFRTLEESESFCSYMEQLGNYYCICENDNY